MEKTSEGVCVTLNGLSPVSLAWSAIEFDVKIAAATNGTVTADVSKATTGTEVTITVAPKFGYKMATLTVKDSAGISYPIGTDNNSKYGFTMPAADVTVTATFSKISSSTADPTNPKTGDDFHILLYCSVLTMSLAGLTALLLASRKRRRTV